MIARRYITEAEKQLAREMSAEGKSKTSFADAIGANLKWLAREAVRAEFDDELAELFPARQPLVMDDAMMTTFRKLSKEMDMRAACTTLKTTPYIAKKAAEEAGRLDEWCSFFPKIRKRLTESEPEEVILPRDVCPQVKWLTKEWRKAA